MGWADNPPSHENMKKERRPLSSIALDYFEYAGRHIPQQCASDEFYFLPRAESAVKHLNVLDDLTPEKIQDHIRYVQNLLSETSEEERNDLEGEIDRLLLRQSMESFIKEFDETGPWRTDPTLYVKIPLFATDQVLSQSDGQRDQLRASLPILFAQIPSFLKLAIGNLSLPSEISLKVALDMVEDALQFYHHDVRIFMEDRIGEDAEVSAKNQHVLEAWERYKRELLELPSRSSFAVGECGLKRILSVNLGYPRSPREIFEIARHSYQKTQETIREFARRIDSRKTWKAIVRQQLPSGCSPEEFLHLYQNEVENLRRFFYSQGIITFPFGEKLTVIQTPSYLQSLRATASYRAPLTGHTTGPGIFYITPGKEDLEMISTHCPYLSAHETYPGHHLLDHLRIHHSNPIRRQIESPLFYEGWACYGEQLLNELGYIQDQRQQLIHLKRLLWRSLRAAMDVELQTGKVTLVQAAKKMETFGFSTQRTQRQIRRFALTPGYQLCYFMGMYEINRLRKRFSSRLGLKSFHDTLLGGGEIPFHLVERRLEAGDAKWKKSKN